MKFLLLLLFSVWGCWMAVGKDPTPVTQVHWMGAWKIPPELIPGFKAPNESAAVRNWIEAQRVKFSPTDRVTADSAGNVAVWSEKRETLRAVEQAFTFGPPFPDEINIRVEVALVEFPTDKMPALQGEIPYMTLRKAAGKFWHVLNQMVITTNSGRRVFATTKTGTINNPSAKPTPPQDQSPSWDVKPLPPGVLGTSLDVEPVLDNGRHQIDVNMTYHYRGAGDRVWNLTALHSITVADGVPVIAQMDTESSGKPRSHPAMSRALVVRMTVLGRKKEWPDYRQPEIHTLPGPPFKVWHVPPRTFQGAGVKLLRSEEGNQWDLREWFARHGVKLSPDELATYDPQQNTLVVRAKAGTLDLVDQLGFRAWTPELPSMERVEFDLVEFSAAKLPGLGGEIPVDTLRKAAGKTWRLFNRLVIVTKSGQRAVTESTVEARTGETSVKPDSDEFLEAHKSGASLEIEPTAWEGNIETNVAYKYRSPEIPVWKWEVTTSAKVRDGVPLVVRLDSDPLDSTKRRALILRADILHPTEKLELHRSKERHASAELKKSITARFYIVTCTK